MSPGISPGMPRRERSGPGRPLPSAFWVPRSFSPALQEPNPAVPGQIWGIRGVENRDLAGWTLLEAEAASSRLGLVPSAWNVQGGRVGG